MQIREDYLIEHGNYTHEIQEMNTGNEYRKGSILEILLKL